MQRSDSILGELDQADRFGELSDTGVVSKPNGLVIEYGIIFSKSIIRYFSGASQIGPQMLNHGVLYHTGIHISHNIPFYPTITFLLSISNT